MQPHQIATEDGAISVAVRGGDPAFVFLHGLAGWGGEWDAVIKHLDATTGCIVPDLRAHGASWEQGMRRVDRDGFVDDVVAMIETLAGEAVVLVGQSMGGIVATLVAHRQPDLVAQLVLVEAGMAPMAEQDLATLREWFAAWPQPFANEEAATEFFGADRPSTPAWVRGLARTPNGLVRRFEPDAMIDTMRALATESRLEEWSALAMPLTVVRAAESVLADEDIAEMMERQPEAEFVTIGSSGHDLHLDQPARLAAVLSRVTSERL